MILGTFLEGETVLVMAGLAAERGYLGLPGVMASAMVGTLAGDWLYFYLGRRHGQAVLSRRPQWRLRMAPVHALVERHPTAVTLGFRFLWGLRSITPFVLGTSRMNAVRFALMNAASAVVWAVAVASAGYTLGNAAELFLHDARRYEALLFAAVAVAGLAAWWVHFARARRRARAVG